MFQVPDGTKRISLNNQLCIIRSTLIYLNPSKYSRGLHKL